MKKVIIIGCPGAGKSTFSIALKEKTGLPLYHLDMLFWNADKTHVSREVFDERLSYVLEQEKWIIDGNYSRTLKKRLQVCDTVFLLDFPVDVCLSGAVERIGKARRDMPWIENEFDKDFENFILNFSQNELSQIYLLLKEQVDKKIIIFKSRKDVEDYLGSN